MTTAKRAKQAQVSRVRKRKSTGCEWCDKLPWAEKARRQCVCGGFNLDIGCGPNKQKGFRGIDKRELNSVDFIWDLEVLPFPFKSNTVLQVLASHFCEHLNPKIFIDWMNDLWRIMRADSQFLCITPHAASYGMKQDPTHRGSGFVEATWEYFCPFKESNLYRVYEPYPWNIIRLHSHPLSNIEVILCPIKDAKILKKLGFDLKEIEL